MIWVKESTSFSNETHKHISFRRFDAGQVIVSSDFTTFSPFGTRKAEVLNSLIINTTAKANDTTDILQTFR